MRLAKYSAQHLIYSHALPVDSGNPRFRSVALYLFFTAPVLASLD
jgi:hypothetical protein